MHGAAGFPAVGTGPARLNVRDFGAKGDGATKDTTALQQALDRCAVLGGGEVLIPAGNYLTGAIQICSNTLLRFEKDTILTGSGDMAEYPVTTVRWEGRWIQGHIALIYAIDATSIGIVGPGHIEGNPGLGGRPSRTIFTGEPSYRHPALIEFLRCDGIHLKDFSTAYQHIWNIHPTNCRNILIEGLTIRSNTGNGDGIDIDSCQHVRIENCDIATGDDCISLKSGRGAEAFALLQTTEDVSIADCTFADNIFACIGIGSETSGGIRDVRVERCKFTQTGKNTCAFYIEDPPGPRRVPRKTSSATTSTSAPDAPASCASTSLTPACRTSSPSPATLAFPPPRTFVSRTFVSRTFRSWWTVLASMPANRWTA